MEEERERTIEGGGVRRGMDENGKREKGMEKAGKGEP